MGDAAGDAFFDISSITNYYACAPGSRRAPGVVCANAETTGPDIGVTEVEVEVEGAFGPYGTCNICGDDGRSPPTTPRRVYLEIMYVIVRMASFHRQLYPVRHKWAARTRLYFWERKESAAFATAVPRRSRRALAGQRRGQAARVLVLAAQVGRLRIWKMHVARQTRRQKNQEGLPRRSTHFYAAIEERNASCSRATCKTRNSTCWVDCFVDTTLGSNARTACDPTSGMAASQIIEAWTAPFDAWRLGAVPTHGAVQRRLGTAMDDSTIRTAVDAWFADATAAEAAYGHISTWETSG